MKIYFVGLYDYREDRGDVRSIIHSTTSYLCAKNYILEKIEKIKKDDTYKDVVVSEVEPEWEWEIRYTWIYNREEGLSHKFERCYRIEEIELQCDENIPETEKPQLEKLNDSLRKQNDELKDLCAKYIKAISAAKCYLVFWDGGIYEDREGLLTNIHKAKDILYMNGESEKVIRDLYEGWQKNYCRYDCPLKKKESENVHDDKKTNS